MRYLLLLFVVVVIGCGRNDGVRVISPEGDITYLQEGDVISLNSAVNTPLGIVRKINNIDMFSPFTWRDGYKYGRLSPNVDGIYFSVNIGKAELRRYGYNHVSPVLVFCNGEYQLFDKNALEAVVKYSRDPSGTESPSRQKLIKGVYASSKPNQFLPEGSKVYEWDKHVATITEDGLLYHYEGTNSFNLGVTDIRTNGVFLTKDIVLDGEFIYGGLTGKAAIDSLEKDLRIIDYLEELFKEEVNSTLEAVEVRIERE